MANMGLEANLLAVLALQTHVDERAGIVAHQHDSQAGRAPAVGYALAYLGGDCLPHGTGDGIAIENSCGHSRCLDTEANAAPLTVGLLAPLVQRLCRDGQCHDQQKGER